MPMVKYWHKKEYVEAKLTTRDGATIMVMDGEKYPIWGFPRGHLLIPPDKGVKEDGTYETRIKRYGPLSVLKHDIKQVFNEIWRKLDEGQGKETVIKEGLVQLDETLKTLDLLKYDLMPAKTMCPSVREIHRALTKVCKTERSRKMRDILCLVLQEDDAFRYRVQYMAVWFPLIRLNPVKILLYGLKKVEEADVTGDMKRRIRLLSRGLTVALEHEPIKSAFVQFFKECKWRKVKITEADRYHLRAKYFKADMDVLDY